MREIITKIEREKGYTYKVDKEGKVIKESYNWFTDPYTIVAVTIILLAGLYYLQVSEMKTTEENFEESCLTYLELREIWLSRHPGQIPTLEDVFSVERERISNKINPTIE